jgi:uncharacterized protein (TIGR03083 family)
MRAPVIGLLDHEWETIEELCFPLSEEQWKEPTALPGWTVQDNLSHLIGTELSLLGETAPDVDVSDHEHVKSDFGADNETWVAERRQRIGKEVFAEYKEIIARRLAQLDAMSDEDLDKVVRSPVGQVPYRDFLRVRVFDCWMHEQDIRRAVHKPGHLDGPVVDVALARFDQALGYVVGKLVAPPEGTTVEFIVNGPRTRVYPFVVQEGRALVLSAAEAPEHPTVTLGMPLASFVALCGGRWDRQTALKAGGLDVTGDRNLGAAILDSMGFTP